MSKPGSNQIKLEKEDDHERSGLLQRHGNGIDGVEG
jgi:hypothetical protein